MPPFEDESREMNRTEDELKVYLKELRRHTTEKKQARPKNPEGDKPYKPLYKYEKTLTTEVDQRPPFHKFMEFLKNENPELHDELEKPLDLGEVVDMSYLELFESKEAPTVASDDEYPDWVSLPFSLSLPLYSDLYETKQLWELVPESRVYSWTNLVQTPFENLSEKEMNALFTKWHKTLAIANQLWEGSEFGYLGHPRPYYDDPWPSPFTKMDIWEHDLKKELSDAKKKRRVEMMEESRKSLSSEDENGAKEEVEGNKEEFVKDSAKHAISSWGEMDLAKHYGMEEEPLLEDEALENEEGVVFSVTRRSRI